MCMKLLREGKNSSSITWTSALLLNHWKISSSPRKKAYIKKTNKQTKKSIPISLMCNARRRINSFPLTHFFLSPVHFPYCSFLSSRVTVERPWMQHGIPLATCQLWSHHKKQHTSPSQVQEGSNKRICKYIPSRWVWLLNKNPEEYML